MTKIRGKITKCFLYGPRLVFPDRVGGRYGKITCKIIYLMLVRYIILCLQGTVSFTFIVLAFQVSFEEEGIMSECRKRRCRRSRRRPFFLTHVRV